MARTARSNTDNLKFVRERVKRSQEWRKREDYDDLWESLVKMYRGRTIPPELREANDMIVVNIAKATVDVIGPAIALNDPVISVNALSPNQEDHATVAEHVLNYWWKHYDFQSSVQLAAQDYLIVGHGWLKTGWRTVMEDVAKTPEELLQEQLGLDLESDEAEDIVLELSELRVVEDRPFVERVPFEDMFVEPGRQWHNVGWIAQRVVKPFESVRYDKRYKASGRRGLEADELDRDRDDRLAAGELDGEDEQHVTLWEYYDLRTGQMCVFAESGDDFLVEPTAQPYAFGHPFLMLRNYEVPDRMYPMGELESIADLQDELNKTRSQLMNHRRKFQDKVLVDAKGLDEENLMLLMDSEAGTFVPANGMVPLDKITQTVTLSQIPAELYQMSDSIIQNAEYITNVSGFQRGTITDNTRRTATEAGIIADAGNSRVQFKEGQIRKLVSKVARNILMLGQQYMDTIQTARIIGQDGLPFWFEFEPSDIQGQFDVSIEASSMSPQDKSQRKDLAMRGMQQLGAFLVPGGPLDVAEVLKWFMKEGLDMKQPERFLAKIDPMTGMPLGGAPPMGPPPGGQPPVMAPQGPPGVPAPVPPGVDPAAAQNAAAGAVGMAPV